MIKVEEGSWETRIGIEVFKNNFPFLRSYDFNRITVSKIDKLNPHTNPQFCVYTGACGDSEYDTNIFLLNGEGEMLYQLRQGDLFHSNYAHSSNKDEHGEYLIDVLNGYFVTEFIAIITTSFSHWGMGTDHDKQTVVELYQVDNKIVKKWIEEVTPKIERS